VIRLGGETIVAVRERGAKRDEPAVAIVVLPVGAGDRGARAHHRRHWLRTLGRVGEPGAERDPAPRAGGDPPVVRTRLHEARVANHVDVEADGELVAIAAVEAMADRPGGEREVAPRAPAMPRTMRAPQIL